MILIILTILLSEAGVTTLLKERTVEHSLTDNSLDFNKGRKIIKCVSIRPLKIVNFISKNFQPLFFAARNRLA